MPPAKTLGVRFSKIRRLAPAAIFVLVIAISSMGQTTRSSGRQSWPGVTLQNTAKGGRYVGSAKCKLCHFAIYNTYFRTDMSHSTMLPQGAIEKGWLNVPMDFFNENTNRHYKVFCRDFKVYETEYGLDSNGREIFNHTEELAYIVGTGVNGATPVVRRGNYLFQAPISYYTARATWDLSPNYERNDIGFTLPVTAECIACHAGRTQPVRGREGLFEDPPIVELGVSCERCHGPGELHVRERTAGIALRGKSDSSIVNPAKLPTWLADNICMNCHEGDNRTLRPGKSPGDFRPGTPLNEVAVLLKTPLDPNSAQSPLLEHYYSMSLSRCFRESKGKLGCQSCHDPHVQPVAAEAPAYFRGRCVRCHSEKDCTAPVDARQSQTPADACTNCHMPKQPVLTVSHSTLTNHRIVRTVDEPLPSIAFQPTLPGSGYIHVNAVPGIKDDVPAVVLLQAYRRELIGSHLQFKDYYFDLLARLPKKRAADPFILSAFAQKALSDGDIAHAVSYAKRMTEHGSPMPNDYLLLDQVLAESGDLKGCIEALQKALTIAPYNNFVYQRLAMRQFQSRDPSAAEETIRRGLELHPEDNGLREMHAEAVRQGLVH